MTQPTLTKYLREDSQVLGALLTRLKQIKAWNQYLSDCLDEPALAKHCHVVNLLGTSLIAIADSPHWLTRLRFHIPVLLPKLRQYPGLEKIQAICCKAEPYYQSLKSSGKRSRLVLSEKAAAAMTEAASKVQDEKLRLALNRLAKHI
jgi:hypothetical protein